MSSLSHTKWNCKYHILFTPQYRRKIFYGQKRLEIGKILREISDWQRSFWCRGYYVDTVGKNAKRIAEYVKNQLKEDIIGKVNFILTFPVLQGCQTFIIILRRFTV